MYCILIIISTALPPTIRPKKKKNRLYVTETVNMSPVRKTFFFFFYKIRSWDGTGTSRRIYVLLPRAFTLKTSVKKLFYNTRRNRRTGVMDSTAVCPSRLWFDFRLLSPSIVEPRPITFNRYYHSYSNTHYGRLNQSRNGDSCFENNEFKNTPHFRTIRS